MIRVEAGLLCLIRFPLAHYFGVTLDELMGYDEERIQAEIAAVLEEYRGLWMTEPERAREVIKRAYREYPNDYLVMHYYMWNLAGDMADNDTETLLSKDTPEFKLYLKQNMYELTCFAADKKMKEIWFCKECGVADKVKESLALAEALADLRKHTGNEELLLSEYVIYGCLTGYLQRFAVKDADEKAILEKRKAVTDTCNKLAEQDASVKAYILKRYGSERLS